MVRLQLSIKVELENVIDLVPSDDDFGYLFKVKCNSCHEEHPKLVSLNRNEEREVSGGKGNTANFVWRCGNCKRESSAKFDPTPCTPYRSEVAAFEPLLTIECRGLEFIDFEPQGTWKCIGTESGTPFPEVEFSDGEWSDYDEKAALPVRVYDFECKWARAPS